MISKLNSKSLVKPVLFFSIIGWLLYCIFWLSTVLDVYKGILGDDFSHQAIIFRQFSIFYEIVILLVISILSFYKKLDKLKFHLIWVVFSTYIVIYLYLFIFDNISFQLFRFGGLGTVFIFTFLLNLFLSYFSEKLPIKLILIYGVFSLAIAYILIANKLFI